jgi:replicative DNA helicase
VTNQFIHLDDEGQEEFLKLFYDRFAGRLEFYAIRKEPRNEGDRAMYVPSDHEMVRREVQQFGSQEFTESVVRAHLEGRALIGVYPITAESTVAYFAFDFDGKGGDPWEAAVAQAKILREEAGLHVYIERSQSGNGYHVWGFLDGPVNAGIVRHALSPYIDDVDVFDRMYPVQDGVTATQPKGNLIALPLAGTRIERGNSAFVRRDATGAPEVIRDQIAFLRQMRLNPADRMQELFAQAGEYKPQREVTEYAGEAESLGKAWKLTHPVFGCDFWRQGVENPESIDEPLWYAMACNLAQLEDGRELFHEWSRHDARYSPRHTDKKYDQALRQNKPHGCETIRKLGGNCTCDLRFPGKVWHPFEIVKVRTSELIETVELDESVASQSIEEGLGDVVEWLEQVVRDPTLGRGLPTAVPDLRSHFGYRDGELTVTAARNSIGKALGLDAQILTPTGFVRMGEIKVGQAVIGSDGKAHSVVGVYPQGIKPMYKVTFSDGTSVECCDEHLWYTWTAMDDRRGREGSVKSLREIMASLEVGTKPQPDRSNHRIPVVQPVEFEAREVSLDPYLLGVYLGDGTCRNSVRIHNPEVSVRAKVQPRLASSDEVGEDTDGVTFGIRRKQRNNGPTAFMAALRELGLTEAKAADKFIPTEYLYASIEDRLELLRGLLDTDGFVYGTGVEYSTASPALRDGVKWLVQSLGGRASVTERVPAYSYEGEQWEGQTSYRMFIIFDNGIVPVSSEKHLTALKPRDRRYRLSIKSVEFVGEKEAQCIAVDAPDNLFVMDELIVTHNTAYALHEGLFLARENHAAVKFFSLEMTKRQVYLRSLSPLTGITQTRMSTGQLTEEDFRKIRLAQREAAKIDFHVDDTTSHLDSIIESVAEFVLPRQARGKRAVIVIDYLQIIPRLPRENEQDAIARSVTGLKRLAKALNTHVILLCQLNRGADDATTESKTFDSWLRGSGVIEFVADNIQIILGDKGPGVVERSFTQHKQRNGEAGITLTLEFNQPLMLWGAEGTWGVSVPDPDDTESKAPEVSDDDFEEHDFGAFSAAHADLLGGL